MNLLKLQDELKGMADDYLLQHIQQPTGEIPQFMVAAEMQRRKDMREQQAQQAPETTVVDDLEQQGLAALQPPPPAEAPAPAPEQMEQGVAGIPTNMPEVPQSMAGGGIVAFGPGGGVNSDVAKLQQLKDIRDKGMYSTGRGGRQYKSPVFRESDYRYDITKQYPNEMSLNAAIARLEAKIDLDSRTMHPKGQLPEEIRQQALGLYPNAPLTDPVLPLPPELAPPAGKTQPGLGALPTAPVSAPSTTGFDTVKYTDIPSADAQFDALARPELSAGEHMAELKSLLGENQGLAAIKEKLQGMETRAAAEEEQAPWMALMRAGLGIAAGTSPHALSNIAEGGIEGIKGYTAAKERLDAKQEKRFEIETRIAQSERAEDVASAEHGVKSAQADKAREDTRKLKKAEVNIEIGAKNAAAKLKVEETNVANKLKARELGITESHYRAMEAVARQTVSKPDDISVVLDILGKDPAFTGGTPKVKLQMFTDTMRDLKATSSSYKALADSPAVAKSANENTNEYFSRGQGKKELNAAILKGPAAEKELRDKRYNQEFERIARTAGAGGIPTYNPATGKIER